MLLAISGYGTNIRSSPWGVKMAGIDRGGLIATKLSDDGEWSQYDIHAGIIRKKGYIHNKHHWATPVVDQDYGVPFVNQIDGEDIRGDQDAADDTYNDCGAASALMVARYNGFGWEDTVDAVVKRHFVFNEDKPLGSVAEVVRALRGYGLEVTTSVSHDLYGTAKTIANRNLAIQLADYERIPRRKRYSKGGHLFVVKGTSDEGVTILDPYQSNNEAEIPDKMSWQEWYNLIRISQYNTAAQAIIVTSQVTG